MGAERRRVVIVGGGFGGLEAARKLRRADVDVLLIDRANYHLFQPLLYQVAMAGLSPAEIASPIRGLLAEQDNARVELGEVTRVDLRAREVHLRDGCRPYDWLILAVGARSSYFGHDDWEVHAPSLKSVEDALEIRRRVLLAFERAERERDPAERRRHTTFVVIGGGPTGVELAGAIAELAQYVLERDFRSIDPRDAKVILVEAGPRILPSFPTDLSESAVEQLAELGVEVRTGARVVNIDARGVELEGRVGADELPGLGSGREPVRLSASTVLWAAGVRASELTRSLGVPLDPQGRVKVEPDCSLPGHPEVFAIGDVTRFEQDGQPLPGVSPVALQQARHVARIIRREARGSLEERPRFTYFDKGSMATIGRSRAIALARGIKMHGFVAWLAWLFVHIWYLIGFRNRIVVLFNWAWSYLSYKRGARLIVATGWEAHHALPPAERRDDGAPAQLPAPPADARAPELVHPHAREPIPTS